MDLKRILITGSNGLLGQKVVELLSRSNYPILLTSKQDQSVFDEADALPYKKLDITDKHETLKVVEEFEPDVIVNTAAITNVDRCETERELAWRVNVTSLEHLVHAAKLSGSQIIHVSTDYVFDGKSGPYSELDRPNPISYYGRTKLAGENVLRTSGVPHTIVRTMVLYGVAYGVKLNFALWLVKSLSENKPARIVDDQIGNPTLADDVAYAILKIVELQRNGLYHVAGPDLMSRFDFAVALAKEYGFDKKLLTPIKTASLKQPAQRPLKSGFITLKAETELNLKMSGVVQGLQILKNQLDANIHQFALTQSNTSTIEKT